MLDDKSPAVTILWQDQAEYYFVCSSCKADMAHMQWAGSTRVIGNWREAANRELIEYMNNHGSCQFCDMEHGNGGWGIDGVYPCARRRDNKRRAAGWAK